MIKEFLKKHWYRYLLGILVLVLVDLSQLFVPKLVGQVVDHLKLPNPNQRYIWLMISWIMGIALGMAILRFFWRYFIIGASRRFEYVSRNFLFEKLMSLTPGYFDQNRSGDLMAKLTNDLQAVRMALAQGVVMSVDATFMAVMTLFFMGSMVSWRLTWLSCIPLPGLAFVALFFGRM
ncbi:MAG TPA: ABC transporter transmembrane domain-containing protein, partial [Pseudothermotoga sp.]